MAADNANEVRRFNGTTGAFIDDFVTAGSGGLVNPVGISFGPDGNLYVSTDAGAGDRVLRYNGTTGAFINTFVTGGSGGLNGAAFLLFADLPAVAAVPEPSTIALIALGGLSIWGWVRRSHRV